MFMIVPTGRGEDIMAELIPENVYDEILNGIMRWKRRKMSC